MNGKKKIYLALALLIVLCLGSYLAFAKEDKIMIDKPNENYYIAAFIDGVASTTFPTSKDYTANVTCEKDGVAVDIGANVLWNGSKWKLSVDDASLSKVACNIRFETKPTWSSPGEGTLLAAIKNNNTVTTPTTTPGAEISSSTEALLASTADDYGTSYYFRGAVTNNFVEYANMCWRIVRVTGDGSIKLVLYNYNGLTNTNNTPASITPCNVTGDNYAFARYEGDTYKSKFNSSYNDNAYVGFMYGAAGASSYAVAHANTNASTILTNLNKWYTNVLSKQANFNDNQLADTIWCNDKSVVTDTTFNPNNFTLGTNYGYAMNVNYYSATKRLVQASSGSAGGTEPSLICPNDNNGGKLSKFTVSDTKYGIGNLDKKIGLLTADELALAGYASGLGNTTTYLQENATHNWWWSLSPSKFNGSYAFVWIVYGSDGRFGSSGVDGAGGVRPSISLKSTTNVTGDGTSSSPYKIVS